MRWRVTRGERIIFPLVDELFSMLAVRRFRSRPLGLVIACFIGDSAGVDYTEDHSEARLQPIAAHEGVKLYLNPYGTHEAIDESKAVDTLGRRELNA